MLGCTTGLLYTSMYTSIFIFQLDIIGLNKKIYQTARQELQLNIVKKYGKYFKIVLF